MSLSKLRARGQMTEFCPEELSFTSVETAAFLQTMLGRPLAEATADSLTKKTEGWITGLRLAILSLHRQVRFYRVSCCRSFWCGDRHLPFLWMGEFYDIINSNTIDVDR